jgi:hypothetical protein
MTPSVSDHLGRLHPILEEIRVLAKSLEVWAASSKDRKSKSAYHARRASLWLTGVDGPVLHYLKDHLFSVTAAESGAVRDELVVIWNRTKLFQAATVFFMATGLGPWLSIAAAILVRRGARVWWRKRTDKRQIPTGDRDIKPIESRVSASIRRSEGHLDDLTTFWVAAAAEIAKTFGVAAAEELSDKALRLVLVTAFMLAMFGSLRFSRETNWGQRSWNRLSEASAVRAKGLITPVFELARGSRLFERLTQEIGRPTKTAAERSGNE